MGKKLGDRGNAVTPLEKEYKSFPLNLTSSTPAENKDGSCTSKRAFIFNF